MNKRPTSHIVVNAPAKLAKSDDDNTGCGILVLMVLAALASGGVCLVTGFALGYFLR